MKKLLTFVTLLIFAAANHLAGQDMAASSFAGNESHAGNRAASAVNAKFSMPPAGQTGAAAYSADEKAGEIRFGVNVLTAVDIATFIAKGVIGGMAGYDEMTVESKYAFTLSYLHRPDNRISFGGDLIFEQTRTTYEPDNGTMPELESDDNWLAVMPRMDINWINAKALKVYSSLAAGVTYYSSHTPQNGESSSKITYAFQISPAGLRFGNAFAIYAEAGFGFRGMLHGGLSYKF